MALSRLSTGLFATLITTLSYGKISACRIILSVADLCNGNRNRGDIICSIECGIDAQEKIFRPAEFNSCCCIFAYFHFCDCGEHDDTVNSNCDVYSLALRILSEYG